MARILSLFNIQLLRGSLWKMFGQLREKALQRVIPSNAMIGWIIASRISHARQWWRNKEKVFPYIHFTVLIAKMTIHGASQILLHSLKW